MSIRKAAEANSIPRSTLHDHVKGKLEVGSQPGPPTVLTSDEEGVLVDCTISVKNWLW